jgi:hypothetical protein
MQFQRAYGMTVYTVYMGPINQQLRQTPGILKTNQCEGYALKTLPGTHWLLADVFILYSQYLSTSTTYWVWEFCALKSREIRYFNVLYNRVFKNRRNPWKQLTLEKLFEIVKLKKKKKTENVILTYYDHSVFKNRRNPRKQLTLEKLLESVKQKKKASTLF